MIGDRHLNFDLKAEHNGAKWRTRGLMGHRAGDFSQKPSVIKSSKRTEQLISVRSLCGCRVHSIASYSLLLADIQPGEKNQQENVRQFRNYGECNVTSHMHLTFLLPWTQFDFQIANYLFDLEANLTRLCVCGRTSWSKQQRTRQERVF